MIGEVAAVAAGNVATNIYNAVSNDNNNKANRDFQEDMWYLNARYNHPYNQMQRFKEAGLNPHLIYGQGNAGNMQPVSPPDRNPTKLDFQSLQNSYQSARMQQVQIDNMKKNQEVMDADIVNKKASALNALSNSNLTDMRKEQLEQMFGLTKATAEANLQSTNVGIQKISQDMAVQMEQLGLQKNMNDAQISNLQRQGQKIVQDISESFARIKQMAISGNNTAIDTEIKKIQRDLFWKQGMSPNDSAVNQIIKKTTFPLWESTKSFFSKKGLATVLAGLEALWGTYDYSK